MLVSGQKARLGGRGRGSPGIGLLMALAAHLLDNLIKQDAADLIIADALDH
jgi:hypothetical protein